MSNPVARYFYSSLSGLRRRPVLAAMMVYSMGFAAMALMATIAVWRSTASCPSSRRTDHLYLAQAVSTGLSPAGYSHSSARSLSGPEV
jgi:hypothetical protein